MIDHIDARLTAWGEWAKQGAGPRLDYPSVAVWAKQRGSLSQPPENPAAEQLDKIIATLSENKRDLVMDWYFSRRTNSVLMARYNLSRTVLYETMDRIHYWIDGRLYG